MNVLAGIWYAKYGSMDSPTLTLLLCGVGLFMFGLCFGVLIGKNVRGDK